MSVPVASSIVAVKALRSFNLNEGIPGWRSLWAFNRLVKVSWLRGVPALKCRFALLAEPLRRSPVLSISERRTRCTTPVMLCGILTLWGDIAE